jgi:hypothetical protein
MVRMLKTFLGLCYVFFCLPSCYPHRGVFGEVFDFFKLLQMSLVFLFFLWQVLGCWTRHYGAWDDNPSQYGSVTPRELPV